METRKANRKIVEERVDAAIDELMRLRQTALDLVDVATMHQERFEVAADQLARLTKDNRELRARHKGMAAAQIAATVFLVGLGAVLALAAKAFMFD